VTANVSHIASFLRAPMKFAVMEISNFAAAFYLVQCEMLA